MQESLGYKEIPENSSSPGMKIKIASIGTD